MGNGHIAMATPRATIVQSTQSTQTTVEEVEKLLTTEEKVEIYFSDIPVLVDVARCESHFRQLDKNGNILRGVANPDDVGVMQINERYHLEKAKKLGLDIYSLQGNMEFARYLYEKEGAKPWLASSKCWAQYQNIAKS